MEDKVRCKTTGKLLARRSADGLYFWCKEHRRWEHWTWAELMATEEKPAANS